MLKKKTLIPLMTVLLLSLTACASNEENSELVTDTPPVENTDQTASDTPVNDTENANIEMQPEEAFDIYMEKFPTAMIKKIQIDKDMGKYVYKVEGFEENKEHEVTIDPADGTITKENTETDNDMDNMEITRDNVAKVMSMVDKALTDAGEDAELEEWTIDANDGKTRLEIEINKKGFDNEERTYDVETGELVEMDS